MSVDARGPSAFCSLKFAEATVFDSEPMNVMALLAHKYADVGPFDEARDGEGMLQLAAAVGADGQFGVHYSTLTRS